MCVIGIGCRVQTVDVTLPGHILSFFATSFVRTFWIHDFLLFPIRTVFFFQFLSRIHTRTPSNRLRESIILFTRSGWKVIISKYSAKSTLHDWMKSQCNTSIFFSHILSFTLSIMRQMQRSFVARFHCALCCLIVCSSNVILCSSCFYFFFQWLNAGKFCLSRTKN